METAHSPLFTDQYEIVMAYGYWRLGKAEQEAVFQNFFRHNPFNSNYTVCAGLELVIDFIHAWKFSQSDLDYLSSLTNRAHQPLFTQEFLHYLSQLAFTGDIDVIPEGTPVFPNEPLLRIKAPLLQCQLLETALTNLLQFSSLIATKASRVRQAAQQDTVIEFGLRRSQGPNGGLSASRAAYIGGCNSTSNVLAGKLYGIPVQGTQAHSWIMAFADEAAAFNSFATAIPDQVTLLVDTYHTITGIENAINTGKQLQAQGYSLQAIRLDSGDLAELSRTARQRLDAAGFTATKILASGDLDEYSIAKLKGEGAPIDSWGVGTRLITAYEHPALDMIYKLTAIANDTGTWDYKIKISDSPNKATYPGILQVRRYFQHQNYLADVLFDLPTGLNADDIPLVQSATHYEDLLTPIFQQGLCVYKKPSLPEIQQRCQKQLADFQATHPSETYPLLVEPGLEQIKQQLVLQYGKDFIAF